MRVYELFENFTDDEIVENLVSLLPQYERCRESYAAVLGKLRGKEPELNDMCVRASGFVDPLGFPFHAVEGRDGSLRGDLDEYDGDDPDTPVDYALCFRPWAEWLGMEIDEKTLAHFGQLDMACICLCDMTTHGFSESEVRQAWDDLQERFYGQTLLVETDESIVDLLKRLSKGENPEDERESDHE